MSDASSARPSGVVDIIDDGMTDEEIAAHTQDWLNRIRRSPGVELPESAAEALAACERDEEL